jgi:outer membrane protein OmpA-like peptidoglycan-associated protein
MKHSGFCERAFFPMSLLLMVFSSGCIATQDWVNEKIFPVEKRVSETEAGLTKTNGRVSSLEGQVQTMASQIAALDSRLNQTNAKADRALENLQQLKIDRKLVLDMKDGAFFTSNSTVLTSRAKKEIDSFLSDVVGQAAGTSNLLFVVTGHTDNLGSEKYNFDLARIRADNAASYLSAQKKVDPGQLVVMSYGETVPVGDNKTEAGRAKNRRVEILVYRDAIGVGQAGTAAAR